jgi:large subunit ribosomal protein L4
VAMIVKYDKNGKKTEKKIKLDDSVFGCTINDKLVAQAVRVYLFNQRGSANTKIRSEMRGGGKKLWANNKVGRARTSSSRNPIWKGGGVTFGPRAEQNYKLNMSKKMRAGAFRSVLSQKVQSGQLGVIEEIDLSLATEKPMKLAREIFKSLPEQKKVLVVLDKNDKIAVKTINNIEGYKAMQVGALNIFDILDSNFVLLTEKSVEQILKYWRE